MSSSEEEESDNNYGELFEVDPARAYASGARGSECGSEDDGTNASATGHPLWKEWDYCIDCCPVACSTFTGVDKSQRGRACQVCLYKGRPAVLKDVVVCKAHRVRVCANVPLKQSDMFEWLKKRRSLPAESLKWYADFPDATCWEKLHFYYIPKGLFPGLEDIIKNPNVIKKSGFCNPIKSSGLYEAREAHIELYTSRGFTFLGKANGGGKVELR